MDYDQVTKNDLIGFVTLDISPLIARISSTSSMINPPTNSSEKYQSQADKQLQISGIF